LLLLNTLALAQYSCSCSILLLLLNTLALAQNSCSCSKLLLLLKTLALAQNSCSCSKLLLTNLSSSLSNPEIAMFDFENLTVYTKAKDFNKKVFRFLKSTKLDRTTNDQLRRASFSIMLNIAEGSGRNSKADKRNFYIISRGSTFECVAIFDYLKDIGIIEESQFSEFYNDLDELSRMLFAMIKNLSK
jgi:four helix bundle protein